MHSLRDKLSVLREFSSLTDAYMIDFFVDNHWNKLPLCWQSSLDSIAPSDWPTLLDFDSAVHQMLPLSLLCLRQCVRQMSVDRRPVDGLDQVGALCNLPPSNRPTEPWLGFADELLNKSGHNRALPHQLRVNTKPKKQHEIRRVGEVVVWLRDALEEATNGKVSFRRAIDVGAGLGHLSRLLSIHGHDVGLQVETVDADAAFVQRAKQLDVKLASKHQSLEWSVPQRHTKWIRQGDTLFDDDDQLRSCLIGLHACGDLSSALLREFAANENVVALVSVGCCYHKLNGGLDKQHMQVWPDSDSSKYEECGGFPMSDEYRRLDVRLSFAARELACHAIEQYAERMQADPVALKVHCYRAALEWIIVRRFPDKRHEGIRSVKRAAEMDFWQYARLALEKRPDLQPALEKTDESDCVTESNIDGLLAQWRRVVGFYCLRTMLAPLIESVILTDRLIFLSELGCSATLVPLFDAKISPRNMALIAYKTNS